MANVNKNDWISVAYTGTLKDGTKFDESEDFVFQVGAGKVIKGFDANVENMEIGSEKEFNIPCLEAYGELSDNQKETVPLEFFKGVDKVEIGMTFMAQTPMGPLKVKVLTVDGDKAEVSLNHPLAGEDLTFKLKVISVLTEEEVKAKEVEDKKKMEEFMKAQQDAMAKMQADAAAKTGDSEEDCPEEKCESCAGCDDQAEEPAKEPKKE